MMPSSTAGSHTDPSLIFGRPAWTASRSNPTSGTWTSATRPSISLGLRPRSSPQHATRKNRPARRDIDGCKVLSTHTLRSMRLPAKPARGRRAPVPIGIYPAAGLHPSDVKPIMKILANALSLSCKPRRGGRVRLGNLEDVRILRMHMSLRRRRVR
ncbi:hypothetical protein BT67DRAFT_302421 [Trichocladium antarcticum]|uniref:Uncharacterized protein n=1 Tax=Trichocladium antarcticum TaxID=1450529 RepID=A0AAN6ULA3_9PEZI|nr:hypothetical protein BT67DRAFT_302421 [Trichocladium antarcticum]